MNSCDQFRAATSYVAKWIASQDGVGEESINDWLLFNLSEKASNLKYKKFSRVQEANKTGADWEWWFVEAQYSLKLRVQAKRLRRGKDVYPSLAYANRHGLQIEKLLSDARKYWHFSSVLATTESNGMNLSFPGSCQILTESLLWI